jgi:hypothetical protein
MEVFIPFEEIVFLGKWNLQQSFFFSNYSSQNGENSSKKQIQTMNLTLKMVK